MLRNGIGQPGLREACVRAASQKDLCYGFLTLHHRSSHTDTKPVVGTCLRAWPITLTGNRYPWVNSSLRSTSSFFSYR